MLTAPSNESFDAHQTALYSSNTREEDGFSLVASIVVSLEGRF